MPDYNPWYEDSYALVIGIGEYADPAFPPLAGAVRDAGDMARLVGGDRYGFKVKTLIDDQATKVAIQRALNDLQALEPDSRAIVYFAGHGENIQDRFGRESGVIFTYDSRKNNRYSWLPLEEVTGLIGYTSAKHVLFIFDSCFSGKALHLTKLRSAAERYVEKAAYQVLTGGAVEVVVDDRSMTRMLLPLLAHPEGGNPIRLTTLHPRLQEDMERAGCVQIPQAGHLEGSEGGDFVFYVPSIQSIWDELPPELRYVIHGDAGVRLMALDRVPAYLRDPDFADALRLALNERLIDESDRQVRARLVEILTEDRERLRLEAEERARKEEAERQEQARLQAEAEAREHARREEIERLKQARLPAEAEARERAGDESPAIEPRRATPGWLSNPRILWGAGLIMIGIVAALGGLLRGGDGEGAHTPPAETEFPTQAAVAVSTDVPTSEPFTDVPASDTPTPTQTPKPPLTHERAIQLAEAGVARNADWTPYMEEVDRVLMALVPAGCFQMGSTDASPVHEVCFEEPFWIDVYEVTNEQMGGAAPRCTEWSSGGNQPRTCISWTDSLAHCEARGARLPTEAEWEYAARGPDGLVYPWGNDFDGTLVNFCDQNCPYDHADNTVDDGHTVSAPVGSYPGGISWVGAYDLSGNVCEWVNDWFDYKYYGTLADGVVNPQGPNSGQYRVFRGGSWDVGDIGLLSSLRIGTAPSGEDIGNGFRCALSWQS